jgi:hypothetical protein
MEKNMRKIVLVFISFLLLACSTLSLKDLTPPSNTPVAPINPVPNETLVALYVQATVLAQNIQQNLAQKTPTPSQGCAQLPCPTCAAAAEITSPIFPASPTVLDPSNANNGEKRVSKEAVVSTSTPTAAQLKPYQVQANTPIYLSNFAHQDQACKWSGIAGQVFDLSGNPAKNIVLIVDGKLNGTRINAVAMTGMTNLYGPGGYEIVLGNAPVDSTAALTLTVYGLEGNPLSEEIPFNTNGDCQKNLTMINFQQVR